MKGKSFVVTGDSKGLGHKISLKLLEKGGNVLGLSRSKPKRVEEKISNYEDRYEHLNFDLSNVGGIRELYKNSIKKIGPIDGLVNNAGMAYDDLVSNASLSSIDKMFRVNVYAPILMSKFIIRDMLLNRREGALVHISSVSSITGYKGLAMYGSTKGALESFSRGIAREWGERGIRSNCISPGFMETDMTSGLSNEQRDRIYRRTALQEATSVDSVAELAIFLLSEAAESITGETIRVDAGVL